MPAETTSSEAEKKEQALLRKADHLSDFGTLTSLGSTGIYFVEKVLNRELPRKLNTLLLASVAVGMGAVFSSFAVRYKAGKVALDDDARLSGQVVITADKQR